MAPGYLPLQMPWKISFGTECPLRPFDHFSRRPRKPSNVPQLTGAKEMHIAVTGHLKEQIALWLQIHLTQTAVVNQHLLGIHGPGVQIAKA